MFIRDVIRYFEARSLNHLRSGFRTAHECSSRISNQLLVVIGGVTADEGTTCD